MTSLDGALTGILAGPNRLKLGTFATNLGRGGTISTAPGMLAAEWGPVRDAARLAEGLGFEALVPVARWKGFGGVTDYGVTSFETLSWAAGLAAQTERIYVFATCHVPVIHPILAAKQLVTIDHISGGRCGLNIVGGWHRPEIEMFGIELLEHDLRYELADEWTAVLMQLWSSGVVFDHDGTFFHLKAAVCEPKPLQRPRPPIMNAGGSPRGRRFAAEHADIVYLFLADLDDTEGTAATVAAYRDEASALGRELSVWTSATVICADTREEARTVERFVIEEHGDGVAVDNLLAMMGIESAVLGDRAHAVRNRFIAGWGGTPLVGTPADIAEGLGAIAGAGYDGCLLLFPYWQQGLEFFGEAVLPLIEQAGLRQPFIV